MQAIDVTRAVRGCGLVRLLLKMALLASVTVWAVATTAPGLAQPRSAAVRATIDASRTYAPISPYVYGQFVEHIGGIVNRGLWAEMLDDRKFYHPMAPAGTPPPAPEDRRALRRWTIIGPADAVAMDRERPYVGEHSPLVRLGPEARGIRQAGLAIRKGRSYTGRVVLAGDPGGRVTVTLAWGTGPGDRSEVVIGRPSPSFTRSRLRFTASGDSDDARLEITGTGAGALRIGAVSLMPADNVEGFRKDAVAALRELRSGVYRFPGGNFVSAHEWREAIGDRDRRPPVLDPAWNAVQPNDVGTDEFMTLCRLLGVEPYVTVNAGFGDAWSAAEYVEYANGAATTRMGRRRARNGHPEPYRVKYWGIGNEPWGEWQFGAGPLAQFVVKHKLFAKAMRRVDPTITLIAGGAMPDTMTQSRQALRLGGKVGPDPLSPADWTGGLFLHALDDMDLISEHFYSYDNQRFDLAKGDRVPVDPGEPLVEWMRQPANRVRAKHEAYQDYLERIPALRTKRVPIALSEWAYARMRPNSYKVVPAYAWVFHEIFRHSDLYQMACFTFATSLVAANRTEAVLNPAGLLFKLYRDHFGVVPVDVSGDTPPPPPRYPVGGEQPEVNAGSPTFPLDVAAAWTEDRGALTVAVINPTESEQPLDLTVTGADLRAGGKLWRMAPATLDATITPGRKPEVDVEEQAVAGLPASGRYPPFSVSLFVIPARQAADRPAPGPVVAAPAPAAARPNIVLILADDLGFSDLASYGGEIPTPHLDRLAAEGVRFTQFYNAARCSPTRASLLTGRTPHAVGIGHLNGPGVYPGDLDRSAPTVAELLREAGYATYMVGKWHVTPWPGPGHNHPRRRGFDRFYGILASIRSYYSPPSLMRDDEPLSPPEGDYHFTDALSDAAAAFVREHDARRPFFLYVAHAAPHWPIHAREADVVRHLDRYRTGWDAVRRERHRRLAELGLVSAPLAPRDERVMPWEAAGPKDGSPAGWPSTPPWWSRWTVASASSSTCSSAAGWRRTRWWCSFPTTAGAPRRSDPRGARSTSRAGRATGERSASATAPTSSPVPRTPTRATDSNGPTPPTPPSACSRASSTKAGSRRRSSPAGPR